MRFIDVCKAEPLESVVLVVLVAVGRGRGKQEFTTRQIVQRLRFKDFLMPAEDIIMAVKQLCERGALVRSGYREDWSIEAGWRNLRGKRKFNQATYSVPLPELPGAEPQVDGG
jgi:hypothetical protein